MAFEEQAISGGLKTGSFFATPFSKLSLIITAIVFLSLSFVGVAESFQQHSAYPFVERSLLPIIGADTLISQNIDTLEASPRPSYDGFLSKSFPVWLWFWLKFWFVVICNLWMIFFFCWLIYGFWWSLEDGQRLRNILFTVLTFLILSLFIGMILYNVRLSGLCLPDDKGKNFNLQMKNSYPLHGVTKLVTHFVNGDLFYRIADWSQSDFGKIVVSIPQSPNILNDSEVNVSSVSSN